ncbi:hypothetical protein ACH5RR_021345 [Cinchona calisaya]|uniref:Alcohol dehydrogenase-like C-terminal domain-containing protein n=1 Tax=Cinchona calisaya TaxID=153742 RepID=A0ABD2ZIT8_9GENT
MRWSTGLVSLLAARAFGAPRIVVVDVDDFCLSVAKDLGAFATSKVSTINEAIGGLGIDVTLDCVDFNKTMTTSLSATRYGGKECLEGMGHCDITIPLIPASARYGFYRKQVVDAFETSARGNNVVKVMSNL